MKFAHFSHVWAQPGMTPHQRYEELWRELQLCDELGFDYGFCVEHHFRPDESWMSSPREVTFRHSDISVRLVINFRIDDPNWGRLGWGYFAFVSNA
jgi:hypothetical protein